MIECVFLIEVRKLNRLNDKSLIIKSIKFLSYIHLYGNSTYFFTVLNMSLFDKLKFSLKNKLANNK